VMKSRSSFPSPSASTSRTARAFAVGDRFAGGIEVVAQAGVFLDTGGTSTNFRGRNFVIDRTASQANEFRSESHPKTTGDPQLGKKHQKRTSAASGA